jgi:hypothetical protein
VAPTLMTAVLTPPASLQAELMPPHLPRSPQGQSRTLRPVRPALPARAHASSRLGAFYWWT